MTKSFYQGILARSVSHGWGVYLASCLLAAIAIPGRAEPPMLMAGSHAISSTGAANYDIPIAVPPGLQGIEPKLFLSYNSQDPNQIAGVGWSLKGLSSVTRCPQTRPQDNALTAVNYTATDRYCLDGKRLMAVSGVEGGDGAEYRTEVDTLQQVKSFGRVGASPAYGPAQFTVKTKDGLVMEYGTSADSRILATGLNAVRVWALKKVSDAKGNYLVVNYVNDTAAGEYYPSSIQYTGNDQITPALSPQSTVWFEYEKRPDSIQKYFAGYGVKSTVRVKSIRTTTAGVTGNIMVYSLAYGVSPTSQRSRLESIQQCTGAGQCLPATRITWDTNGTSKNTYGSVRGFTTAGYFEDSNALPLNNYNKLVGDLNSDGLDDIVALGVATYFNDGQGKYVGRAWQGDGLFIELYETILASFVRDMDGDGLADLVVVRGKAWYRDGPPSTYPQTISVDVYKNVDGNGKYSRSEWAHYAAALSAPPYFKILDVADFDGDGRPDLIVLNDVALDCDWCSSAHALDVYVFKNTGSGFNMVKQQLSGTNFPGLVVFSADINGDGRADIVLAHGSVPDGPTGTQWPYVTSYLSDGSKYIPGPGLDTSAFLSNLDFDAFAMGDFNGDGYPDLLRVARTGTVYGVAVLEFAINTGKGFVRQEWSVPRDPVISWPVKFLIRDVNGDGLSDFVNPYATSSGTGTYVLRSTGSSMVGEVWSTGEPFYMKEIWFSSEIDGYGTGGIIHGFPQDGRLSVNSLSPQLITRDRIVKIEKSPLPGGAVSLQYDTLPRILNKQYFKEVPAAFPRIPVVPPISVVTGVDLPTGAPTPRHTTMSYGTMLTEMGGRGNLGFNWKSALDSATGLVEKTYFRQDFPFTGSVSQVGKGSSASNWNNLRFNTQTYGCFDPAAGPSVVCTVGPGKRYFIYPSQSDVREWDLNGAPVAWNRTQNADFDSYGNPKTVTTRQLNADGSATDYAKTVTNTYYNNPTNWVIGRVTKSVSDVTGPTVPSPVLPGSGASSVGASPALPGSVLSVILNLLLDD